MKYRRRPASFCVTPVYLPQSLYTERGVISGQDLGEYDQDGQRKLKDELWLILTLSERK
jgi:hypothetical protein